MRARHLWVAIPVLAVLAACTTQRTGSSAPTNTSRSASGSNSSTPVLPPRPRELDLTYVNPCTDVLTMDQLHQLAYDLGYQRQPILGKSDIHGGPSCLFSSTDPPDQPSRDLASLVLISTSEGAEVWLTDPRRKPPPDKYRLVTVMGYPALVLPHPFIVDNCDLVVDVHKGQYLEVDSSPGTSKSGTSPDPYCAEAQKVAGMIIQNLSARK
jgi:hypothetical protein